MKKTFIQLKTGLIIRFSFTDHIDYTNSNNLFNNTILNGDIVSDTNFMKDYLYWSFIPIRNFEYNINDVIAQWEI